MQSGPRKALPCTSFWRMLANEVYRAVSSLSGCGGEANLEESEDVLEIGADLVGSVLTESKRLWPQNGNSKTAGCLDSDL